MKKPNFRFEPTTWLDSKPLRSCSPAARGVWLDLLCLMHPNGGYLKLNGRPIDDNQIAGMIGVPIKTLKSCLGELGEAGIFDVSPDGFMYSSRMVRESEFSARAKEFGKVGQGRKKAKAGAPSMDEYADILSRRIPEQRKTTDSIPKVAAHPVQAPASKAKTLAWYDTKPGWIRHANSQAMSMQSGEEFEQFQCRLAARIPPGMHLQALTEVQRKIVETMRPKGPGEAK